MKIIFFLISSILIFSCEPNNMTPTEDINLEANIVSYETNANNIKALYKIINFSKTKVSEYTIWIRVVSDKIIFEEKFISGPIESMSHLTNQVTIDSYGLLVKEVYVSRVSFKE